MTSSKGLPARQNRLNFVEQAYDRLEELLVSCALKPGRLLNMQELQLMTGFGRTPIHNAVNRLAADTLVVIRPRHGLQIAPIDLSRERMLLSLRRDIERFVVNLAIERASFAHRNQMLHLEHALRSQQGEITLEAFNLIDRRIDRLILAAAEEPFLEHTLRPLHTIFRRIGFIHHTLVQTDAAFRGKTGLKGTIGHHLAILNAVANRHVARAMAASDALMDFVETMFDEMEAGIDPCLLDCSIEPLGKG